MVHKTVGNVKVISHLTSIQLENLSCHDHHRHYENLKAFHVYMVKLMKD